jgi:hypothetical protein
MLINAIKIAEVTDLVALEMLKSFGRKNQLAERSRRPVVRNHSR